MRVLLLDRQGTIVYDTATTNDLRGQTFNGLLPRPGDPRTITNDRYVPPTGPSLLYVAIPVEAFLGRMDAAGVTYLILAQPSAFQQVLGLLVSRLLIAGVVAVLAAAAISLAVANSLYNPIKRLTAASEQMARGNYDQSVPVQGSLELQELAATFDRMAAEVQQSRQVLRDFVADVSHELRTPLTSIRGFVLALSDGTIVDEAERRKALAVVDEEAKRLHRLVTRLLDLSRIESGQATMAREEVPLADFRSTLATSSHAGRRRRSSCAAK